MTFLALIALLGWLYLALLHGQFWKPFLDTPAHAPKTWPSVSIVVPARNEEEILPKALPSLLAQDYAGEWNIILVDDHSTDGTSAVARRLADATQHPERLTLHAAPDLAEGWRGKVAAMNAGTAQSQSDYILFTDADIWHPRDSLRRLVSSAEVDKLDLVSRMVKLNCTSFAEKLLIPAFVFFFGMLYPFREASDPLSCVAAAAGGTMLVKRKTLEKSGGLERIQGALIDDCALARLIKSNGGHIHLGLTHDILSLRPYPKIGDVWDMIARTAFTQLNYSLPLLVGTVVGLGLLFVVPFLAIAFGWVWGLGTGLAAWLLMSGLYSPMVRFYNLPLFWAFALPVAACIYIAATIDSARRYRQGRGGQWKGRALVVCLS